MSCNVVLNTNIYTKILQIYYVNVIFVYNSLTTIYFVYIDYIYIYVTMVWVQIPSREEQKFDSSKI